MIHTQPASHFNLGRLSVFFFFSWLHSGLRFWTFLTKSLKLKWFAFFGLCLCLYLCMHVCMYCTYNTYISQGHRIIGYVCMYMYKYMYIHTGKALNETLWESKLAICWWTRLSQAHYYLGAQAASHRRGRREQMTFDSRNICSPAVAG